MDQAPGELNQRMGQSSARNVERSSDAAIVIGSHEIAEARAKSSGSALSENVKGGEGEKSEGEDKCSSWVIDIIRSDLVGETQRLCRICHLSAKESGTSSSELVELGCACKGELGVAHLHCAEAWFRVRGNRLCEICGETVQNVKGVGDNQFMEEWNESRSFDTGASSLDGNRRCLRGQPLCNLLMACLVIGFVLPWFFRGSMF